MIERREDELEGVWCPKSMIVDHEGHSHNRIRCSDRKFPLGTECMGSSCGWWNETGHVLKEENKVRISFGHCGILKNET